MDKMDRTIKDVENDIKSYEGALHRMLKRGCKACEERRYRIFIADLYKELEILKEGKQ